MISGTRSLATKACSFVVRPPRERPIAWRLCSPRAGPVHWQVDDRAVQRQRVQVQLRQQLLLMERAYERDRTRRLAREPDYQPIVSPESNRHRPSGYDVRHYRRRHDIERLFGQLKRIRRIAIRYDKLDVIVLSRIYLALIYELLPSM